MQRQRRRTSVGSASPVIIMQRRARRKMWNRVFRGSMVVWNSSISYHIMYLDAFSIRYSCLLGCTEMIVLFDIIAYLEVLKCL